MSAENPCIDFDEKELREIKSKEDFWHMQEAQCLGLADNAESAGDYTVQVINTFLFGGLLLSLFGAVTSAGLARWLGQQTERGALMLFKDL
ncbi:hypothetical protein FRC10_007145 [Ceratobasidium sp. 414]|nr:hypothetical protein FRC10_007145 [Ceratobasidium sp. 414]